MNCLQRSLLGGAEKFLSQTDRRADVKGATLTKSFAVSLPLHIQRRYVLEANSLRGLVVVCSKLLNKTSRPNGQDI